MSAQNSDLRWLPTTVKEMQSLGWHSVDVILVSGDAYIDHPSFGIAVLGRLLEKMGLRVAILPQPNWQDDLRDFRKLGKPNLFFGVSSGSMDSMINNYTGNKRKRSDDAYPPGGKAGFRPDYAAYVYTGILKKLYPDIPVILGGIEASLRRLVHYDYWSDSLKPSILFDTNADLLIYGMGEKPLKALVEKLRSGIPIDSIRDIPQTAFIQAKIPDIESGNTSRVLDSFDDCIRDKKTFARTFQIIEEESNKKMSARIIQAHGNKVVVVNPPYTSYSQEEIDEPYSLPYTRQPHPRYQKKEPIPAFEMIKFSINIHRGCFGGCSFCTISAHQGKFIQSRSEDSILHEVKEVSQQSDFKGHISDLGGPSANMYQMKGENPDICAKCKRYSCIYPRICRNLQTDHSAMLELYAKVAAVRGIKKITIGSGIRYDLFLKNPFPHPSHKKYLEEVLLNHVSGRLKVAPEHSEDHVLRIMRKPSFELFQQLKMQFDQFNEKHRLKQQLIPYFISAHPGTTLTDMAHLAVKTKHMGYYLEQVQEFTPTPMTVASVMYYTGLDPENLKPVFIPIKKEERQLQRKFLFWYKPENRNELQAYLRKKGMVTLANALLGHSRKNNK